MVGFIYSCVKTYLGLPFPVTLSLVIITSKTSLRVGISNIMPTIIFSIIERRPLAPVFLSTAFSAIASIASSSKVKRTPSISKSFIYCFTREFLGSLIIFVSAPLSRLFSVTIIGILPTSSGISPNLTIS